MARFLCVRGYILKQAHTIMQPDFEKDHQRNMRNSHQDIIKFQSGLFKTGLGFSLVELVIVIIVVGLLAVTALPRFLDVTDEAKKASIEGVAGGFATAVLSARAQWEAKGRPKAEADDNQSHPSIDYDGALFWLTSAQQSGFRDGYPIALKKDSYPSVLTHAHCVELMENLLQSPPLTLAVDAAPNKDQKYSAQADSTEWTCTYAQLYGQTHTQHQFVYEVKTGRVTVNLN